MVVTGYPYCRSRTNRAAPAEVDCAGVSHAIAIAGFLTLTTQRLPKLTPSSTQPELVAYTSAPDSRASRASWSPRSGGLPAILNIRLPSGNFVPFCVNPLSLECTFKSRRSADASKRPADWPPHGTRYATLAPPPCISPGRMRDGFAGSKLPSETAVFPHRLHVEQ